MRKIIHLKHYKQMDAREQMQYLDDLKTWSENDYVQLCKITCAWEQCDLKSYDDGLQLLSAFSRCHDFISSALQGDARRYIRRLGDYIEMIKQETNLDKVMTRDSSDKKIHVAVVPPIAADGAKDETKKQMDEILAKYTDEQRPKHISEYVHLLSPELQARTENIAGLRAAVAKHAELAKKMSDDKDIAIETVEAECATALKYQEELDAIYRACDKEFEAYAKAEAEKEAAAKAADAKATEGGAPEATEGAGNTFTEIVPGKSKGSYTKAEIDNMEEGSFQGECKAARINADRTYIKRKDVKDKSALEARLQELVEWGEMTKDDAEARLLASEAPVITEQPEPEA